MSAPATVANEKPSRRVTLSRRASFWAAAACAFLAFAASTAASPLYRVYEDKFSFAPPTLTLLFTVYIVVLLGTLLLFGSVSDYTGRRMVLLAGLTLGAAGCGLFLIGHGVGLLFAARALQGVSRLALSPERPVRRYSICDQTAALHRSSPARRQQAAKPSAQSARACWRSTLPR